MNSQIFTYKWVSKMLCQINDFALEWWKVLAVVSDVLSHFHLPLSSASADFPANSELISLFRGKFTWVVRCSWHVPSSAALQAGKLTILVSPWLCSCSWASRHGWWPSRARWLCIWAWDTSPGLPLPAFCSSSGSHSMRSNCEVLFFPFSLPRTTAF